MTQPDDSGFVKRGFWMLGLMTVLVLVVLGIILYRPTPAPPGNVQNLPREESSTGWQVRYNATVTLLRRGSDHVPWKNVREMLDESQQMRNNMVTLQDGRDVPDEAAARATVISALRALGEWHRKQSAREAKGEFPQLPEIHARVDELSKSPILELRVQAEHARQTFNK